MNSPCIRKVAASSPDPLTCTGMNQPPEYKRTWFDKHGADAGARLRAFALGLLAAGITYSAGMLTGLASPMLLALIALVLGVIAAGASLVLSHVAGAAYTHLMVSGSSTPYAQQYSYQQALVMQGRINDALESFEAVIAESPDSVDVRVRTAELYLRDKRDAVRAAELFREIQRMPLVTQGEDIYATNRLCDLLTGPLNDRGRALVELRRLIDRYPGSPAADHARRAIASLKPAHHES
jgi:hypothetical protein